ncbi:hypothetical protein DPMN_182903 [Dreissena polymorpha]|uniref:Uncharacterized protein n=1 Tax=Dreissena polymorpha TaxID=45954 RepID=A0A9D4DF36_DREPO|nr:hypothetical protein DPMN_182903 [Dreissena polymorpha]
MARQRPTRIPTPHIDRIVIRGFQYQLEAILGGCDLCGRGAPGLVMGPCIVEIDRIVIREVQNEEIIVKGNFKWVWSMWAGRPRIDRIVIREVQYQFKVNGCRNEEIIVKGNFGWAWSKWAGRPRIDRIVIRDFQGSMARMDGQTDGQTAEITTISSSFSKTWGLLNFAVF